MKLIKHNKQIEYMSKQYQSTRKVLKKVLISMELLTKIKKREKRMIEKKIRLRTKNKLFSVLEDEKREKLVQQLSIVDVRREYYKQRNTNKQTKDK